MIISVLNNKVYIGADHSLDGAEIFDLPYDDIVKLTTKTHFFDTETKEVVAYPIPEPVEPTEEEIAEQEAIQKEQEKENALKDIEALLLRKQALDLAWESVVDTVAKLAGKLDAVIDLRDISTKEKNDLKFEVNAKL